MQAYINNLARRDLAARFDTHMDAGGSKIFSKSEKIVLPACGIFLSPMAVRLIYPKEKL
jgi:hypothetical protein